MSHPNIAFMKLGKKAARVDERTFKLRDFLDRVTPPPSSDWFGTQTSFGMMLNDNLGDCTCAAPGHSVQVVSLNTPDGEMTPPDAAILEVYEKACGYVPGDPSTDQGGDIINVLNYIRKNKIGSHVLYAYADPDPLDIDHIKQAIATFGVVDIGLQLPISAQDQVGNVWDVTTGSDSEPGGWGGHSVVVCAYDEDTVTCITWGALQKMTWAFWLKYCDEAHALLLRMWMERFGGDSTINVAKVEQLLIDVAA